MAGDWIKWTKGLTRKREVLLIASALNKPAEEIAGRLMILWEWCDDNVTEENIDAIGNAFVTLGAQQNALIDALTGAQGFAEAMQSVGWLRYENCTLTFPNFTRHNGKTAKTRALTQRRVKRSRNADVTQTALPEKRRKEKSISLPTEEKPPTPLVLPAILDNQPFRDAFSGWLKYKQERRESYKPAGMSAVLAAAATKAERFGVQAVIDAMQTARANGWQGWDQKSLFGGENGRTVHGWKQGAGQRFRG